jgi:hypothetical protein
MINEDKLLNTFHTWLRNQPLYVVPDHPDINEQMDEAVTDYILDFCNEREYSEKTEESLLDWIAFRNEVYTFLEEQRIHSKDVDNC